MNRTYFGQPGHFIAAAQCRFHIHTHVGDFCISTVGEYFPLGSNEMEPLGGQRTDLYETMVFRLGPDGQVKDYGSPVFTDRYSNRDAANLWHERNVCRVEGMIIDESVRADMEAKS